MSRPRSAFTVLVLALAVALSGCTITFSPPASPVPGDTAAGSGRDGPGPVERDPDEPTADSEPETRQQDEDAAVRVVDAYWQRHFTEISPRGYVSPQVYGGYLGEDGPPCGGQPSPPYNAFYCPDGDFLAWDEQLMDAGYEQIGDAWVYLVIFHEWAHAVQARLRPYQVDVATELQADCLAGAALQGSIDDELLYLEPGDMQELSSTLVAVADDFPWSDSASHGNAQERTSAFSAGAAGGPSACV